MWTTFNNWIITGLRLITIDTCSHGFLFWGETSFLGGESRNFPQNNFSPPKILSLPPKRFAYSNTRLVPRPRFTLCTGNTHGQDTFRKEILQNGKKYQFFHFRLFSHPKTFFLPQKKKTMHFQLTSQHNSNFPKLDCFTSWRIYWLKFFMWVEPHLWQDTRASENDCNTSEEC